MNDMDIDREAASLYALPPEEFVAARDALASEARSRGDKSVAAAVTKLRRPTVAAWLANLLVRERTAQIDRLGEIGDSLRQAQRELSGVQLRELAAARRSSVRALTEEAKALAVAAGHPPGDAALLQLEDTLNAALADPELAAQLRSGRLTASLKYTGFGDIAAYAESAADVTDGSSGRMDGPPAGRPSDRSAGRMGGASAGRPSDRSAPRPDDRVSGQLPPVDRRAAARRADAKRGLTAAEQIASRAAEDLESAASDSDRAATECAEAEKTVGDLRAELVRAERTVRQARERAARADQRLQVADRAARHADKALARARRTLMALDPDAANHDGA